MNLANLNHEIHQLEARIQRDSAALERANRQLLNLKKKKMQMNQAEAMNNQAILKKEMELDYDPRS